MNRLSGWAPDSGSVIILAEILSRVIVIDNVGAKRLHYTILMFGYAVKWVDEQHLNETPLCLDVYMTYPIKPVWQ